jgi:3-oxoacyl-(acyl-carrier-protein) synthase/NAD(P)H-dependent flavin oxidoreductase YrpB (nitropropane dioxygenase family)
MAQALPVLGITPFCSPDAGLVRALEAAGARGCLDLGTDPRKAERVLRRLGRQLERFAVRIGPTLPVLALPSAVDTVVLHPDVDSEPYADRVRLVQVTTHQQGVQAVAEGADGLIAKGAESGGLVSDTAAPILVQQLASLGVPVWLQGGVGLHTVSGAVALGAHGVVLDAQLALLEEANTPDPIRKVLATMDGSETTVVSGHRVFERPDLPIVALATGLPGNLGAGPLDRRLLPLGQDAAFAAPLAARFRTVAGLVHGLRESAHAQLETAAALQPLAPGNGVAAAHGSGYPIAQGPMTRVSDRAAFAEAVARGGGLPFLALSLSRGDKVRALVEETGLLLPNRPWGVGILGFVPPELRAEQLEVITELRPPLALIAGGRPSQARELEALDIPTFLHVPSPGLLDLFLRDGATRFVFEGRECGGHIGPRHSFVLWEQAVARLLEQGDLSDYELLFAGGIHDGATAAMIAALAAPLAARGARLGVLMGTAYLFTAEAVRSGAIGEVFQQAAVDATQTAAVQTAPGHATRCVRSPFVDAFEARRAELEAAGSSPEETWAEFEKLNLGRLRIASKGIVREGDTLTSVDEDRQRAEGMFMIGDVATLRDDRTTVAELHASVSEGSVAALARWAPRHTSQEEPGPVDVAIVGMAGFFPGAPDVETFWANILANHDAVTEVPPERWDAELYFDPDHVGGERTRSKWGGFLGEIPFDPVTYGIPPRSLAAIEPVQLLALEAAQRALVDAGYDRRVLPRARTSVLFGAEAGTDLAGAYGFRAVWPSYLGELPPELDAMLPKLTEDSFPGVLANVIAGRIANRLDLGGVNYTVDAACASSLAALDQACRELSTGSSDVVLCGGADLHNTINDYLLFSSTHALSPSGRCATFDANADGIALGESVSVVVLKRLADAERDGDRIYAVVRAVGGSSDGRSLGLTAPRKDGQVRALHRAYARAGVPASDVRLVEAHGTGTVVGDRTELETLTEVYESHAPGSVTLGSVKSQIGHTKCAAGLAGLIKVSLALHHRVLPPTLHVRNPNPGWDADDSPFGFRSRPAPWLGDRHAAVSAFGFGGTNFHAVLSAHDTAPTGAEAWPAELLVFRDAADLDRVDAHASANRPPTLRSLARALAARGDGPVVAAIVATDLDDLRARIADHRAGRTHERLFRAAPQTGKVGWLFPGQGSQRPGMLGDLLVHWPELHDLLQLGARWADRIYPADPFDPASRRAQRDAITDTRVAQPTLGIVNLAAARLLDALGLEPDAMAGTATASSWPSRSPVRCPRTTSWRCPRPAAAASSRRLAVSRAPCSRRARRWTCSSRCSTPSPRSSPPT